MTPAPGTSLPLIVAHRGNTLPAFETAMRLGADMVEFDLRRTADHILVLHHDDAIDGRLVADLPYEDALTLSARRDVHVPTLDDVLTAAGGKVRLDLELKVPGFEQDVFDALARHAIPETQVIITSFDAGSLTVVKRLHPRVRTGLLVYDMTWAEAVAGFASLGADVLGPDESMLDDAALDDAAARGITLMPWTVNDPARMARLLTAPAVVALITDRPTEALGQRARLISSGARPHTPGRAD